MKVVIDSTIILLLPSMNIGWQATDQKRIYSAWFLLIPLSDFNPTRYSIQIPDFIILSSSLVTLPVLFTKASRVSLVHSITY